MNAPELASLFNLHRAGRSWRGRCPACRYADAFTLDVKDGRPLGWCASCQDRDAIGRLIGRSGATGAGWTPPPASPRGDDAARRQARQQAALSLWRGAVAAPGTLADRYLQRRGLDHLAASPALRFRADTPHLAGGRYPAMLAVVQNAAGSPVALHRTYLAPDAVKAAIEPAKATLGPVTGGAIHLDEAAPELVIGEGIETAASAGVLLALPAWSAISAGNLARSLILPSVVRSVVIAADPDEAGDRAAREAADRWQREGRRVRIARPNAGGDFNDLMRSRAEAHYAA